MIFLKAKVSVEYHNMDQDVRKYKNAIISVRRDGERVKINEEDLMVGDVLIVDTADTVRIDGIIIKAKNFSVGEAHTILKGDMKVKNDIWSLAQNNDETKDPFVLAGSYVIGGCAEILVCTVGPRCSFRIDSENKGYYAEYTSTMAGLKKTMNKVENTCKLIVLFIATVKSVIYLNYSTAHSKNTLDWMDFLEILKIFCGFMGLVCFVQRLKIIKTLQFFIETNRSEKEYRIKNRATLQQISQLDILFIESTILAMRKVPTRDSFKIELDHIGQISEINKFCRIKIVSEEESSKIIQIFGQDINTQYLFQPDENLPHNCHVKHLAQASFLTKTSVKTFITEYLPIYRALNYKVGYLYDFSNQANNEIPPDVLQISFQRLQINPLFEFQDQQPMNTNTNESSMTELEPNYEFWAKIQNKLFMEDVLFKLFEKSRVYRDLYSVYLSMYINNIFVMATMCYFSTFISLINLSWSLLIIIVNRYMFLAVYKRINQQKSSNSQLCPQTSSGLFDLFKLNLLLLFYYIYVSSRVNFISSLFVFFFANGMLRVEVMLYKKRPVPKAQFLKNICKYWGLYMILHGIVYVLELGSANVLIEELRNVQYVLGLFFIYVAFALVV